MRLLFDITLDYAKDTRLQLEFLQLGDELGFKLLKLSPGKVLKEYNKRARAHADKNGSEPERAIEVVSYETIVRFIEALDVGGVVVEPVRSNILSIPGGLTVGVDPTINKTSTLLGSDIYLYDDQIGDPWIWKDTIAQLEVICPPY